MRAGSERGDRTDVWLDPRGRVTTPPKQDADIWLAAVPIGSAGAAGSAAIVVIVRHVVRRACDRHRMAEWEQEWTLIGPEAARIMARRHVKRLPVVDDIGMLEGIVSRSDLLKVFLRRDEDIADEILRTVVDTLPAAAHVAVSVTDGVVTLSGDLLDRALVPLLARAVRAVEGTIDIRVNLNSPARAANNPAEAAP